MSHWSGDSVVYHLYPLGLCGAPRQNDLSAAPQPRLERMLPWLDHSRDLGATVALLGPVMESGSHGYDVADYFQVDRRLGQRKTLATIAAHAHGLGMKVVLDGVFHHVGRLFWAFRDVLEKGPSSRFVDWFYLDFKGRSPYDDPFSYRAWNGCHDLVKLNLSNPEVRNHLFEAAADWIREYHIDGLRLDAADHVDMTFIHDLGNWCRRMKPDFWLVGEVVKGPYCPWLEDGGIDSVTNYECYKALYSSLNDANYHEIAHCLRRHFGEYGLYPEKRLLSFADNHDVDRVASRLKEPALLYPLYSMLFTIPGIPTIYYGSEFGLTGAKSAHDDWSLRPELNLGELNGNGRSSDLVRAIKRLSRLRTHLPALRHGDFQELFVAPRRIVFSRRTAEQWVIVAISAEATAVEQEITLPEPVHCVLEDLLNPGQYFPVRGGKARLSPLWPRWARVMEVRRA